MQPDGAVLWMKAHTTEIHRLSNEIAVAQRYDAQVKADLFSTALTVGAGLLLIDPISADAAEIPLLDTAVKVCGIVVTNENHVRSSAQVAADCEVPIYAHSAAGVAGAVALGRGDEISGDLRAIAIPGAPAGEIALHCSRDGGTVVFGDALINFGSNGFTFLPAKYCVNSRLMRRSLRQVLEYDFERMLFAHGSPIVTNARGRIASLLESGS